MKVRARLIRITEELEGYAREALEAGETDAFYAAMDAHFYVMKAHNILLDRAKFLQEDDCIDNGVNKCTCKKCVQPMPYQSEGELPY